jgi:lysozyme
MKKARNKYQNGSNPTKDKTLKYFEDSFNNKDYLQRLYNTIPKASDEYKREYANDVIAQRKANLASLLFTNTFPENPNYSGLYDPSNHSVSIVDPNDYYTSVHEGAHGMFKGDQGLLMADVNNILKTIAPLSQSDSSRIKDVKTPAEILSRIYELRAGAAEAGLIKPGENITKDKIIELFKYAEDNDSLNSSIIDLQNALNEEEGSVDKLLFLMNNLTSVDEENNNTTMAKNGGVINKYQEGSTPTNNGYSWSSGQSNNVSTITPATRSGEIKENKKDANKRQEQINQTAKNILASKKSGEFTEEDLSILTQATQINGLNKILIDDNIIKSNRSQDQQVGVIPTAEEFAKNTMATGDKLRLFPSSEGLGRTFDDYGNPLKMLGDLVSGYGRIPKDVGEGNYGSAAFNAAMPLAIGAGAGYGAKGTGQFVNNLANPLAGTGQIIDNLGNKYLPNVNKLNPLVESRNIVSPVTRKSWELEELPGLHLQSTMSNGPISKIVEPKTGLINVQQALGIIGKESGGSDKVALIKQGLGDNLPQKIDFNEFRKIAQNELIPLEKQFSTHKSNYGIDALGYNNLKRGQSIAPESQFLNTPLENKSIILGNKSKFGRGSNAHGNPEETLGHAHFLRDAETPDVLTVTQIQSDAFQGTHRVMPKTQQEAFERVNKLKREGDELKKIFNNDDKTSNSVLSNYEKHLQLDEASAKNFTQKQLLDKNHQERYLQEIVDYAGKRGDVNKVRVPTSDTAAKIQGYKPSRTTEEIIERYNELKGTQEFDELMLNTPDSDKIRLEKILKGEIKGDIYDEEHQTILKKYSEQPKIIKKLFGEEPKLITDTKGNSWYEFDIPKKFKEGKGEIKAFSTTGAIIGAGAALSQQNYKNGGVIKNDKIKKHQQGGQPYVSPYADIFNPNSFYNTFMSGLSGQNVFGATQGNQKFTNFGDNQYSQSLYGAANDAGKFMGEMFPNMNSPMPEWGDAESKRRRDEIRKRKGFESYSKEELDRIAGAEYDQEKLNREQFGKFGQIIPNMAALDQLNKDEEKSYQRGLRDTAQDLYRQPVQTGMRYAANMAKEGGLQQFQNGSVPQRDSINHQVNKILQYEILKGGPGGKPLPYYNDPKYKKMLMDEILPEVNKIMPNASAMEKAEAMDFIFNAGFDKDKKIITKDPRAYALQEYYKKYDKSKLDKDGKWSGRKNPAYSFQEEYDNTIGRLPENERRVLLNLGRDWYYKNINNPAPGVVSTDYADTWYGRIHNTNDYNEFNPNSEKLVHPSKRTPAKKQDGGISGYPFLDFLNPNKATDDKAKQFIKKNEGSVLDKSGNHIAYKDSEGYPTIGYGHFMRGVESPSMSQKGADELFDRDYQLHRSHAEKIPGFNNLNEDQKIALIDMTFNMGPEWYKKFPKFSKALESGNFDEATSQLRDSLWAQQVGPRADRVIKMISNNKQGGAVQHPIRQVHAAMGASTFQNGSTPKLTQADIARLSMEGMNKYGEQGELIQGELRSKLMTAGADEAKADRVLEIIYENINPNADGDDLEERVLRNPKVIEQVKVETGIFLPDYKDDVQSIIELEKGHYYFKNDLQAAKEALDMEETPPKKEIINDKKPPYRYFNQGGNTSMQQQMGYKNTSPFQNMPFQTFNTDTLTMGTKGTRDSVDKTLLAISDNGITKVLFPNSGLHKFEGAKEIMEIPIAEDGGMPEGKDGDVKKSWRDGKKLAVYMDGTWHHFGDSSMQDFRQHKSEERKDAWYARHASALEGDDPRSKAFRKFAKVAWSDGGQPTLDNVDQAGIGGFFKSIGKGIGSAVKGVGNAVSDLGLGIADNFGNSTGFYDIDNDKYKTGLGQNLAGFANTMSATTGKIGRAIGSAVVPGLGSVNSAITGAVNPAQMAPQMQQQQMPQQQGGFDMNMLMQLYPYLAQTILGPNNPNRQAYGYRQGGIVNLTGQINPYRSSPSGFYGQGGLISDTNTWGGTKQPISGATTTGPMGKGRGFNPDYHNSGLQSLFDTPKNDTIPVESLIPIQAEIDELIVMPTGDITRVMATKRHHKMSDDVVTDVVPENAYILSAHGQVKINRDEAENFIVEMGLPPYRVGMSQYKPSEKRLSDIMTKKVMSPAEMGKMIEKKFPITSTNNPFELLANNENKVNRKPYLEGIIQLSEIDRYRKGINIPEQMKQGGPVIRRDEIPHALDPITLSLLTNVAPSVINGVVNYVGAGKQEGAAKDAYGRYSVLNRQNYNTTTGLAGAAAGANLIGIGAQNPVVTPVQLTSPVQPLGMPFSEIQYGANQAYANLPTFERTANSFMEDVAARQASYTKGVQGAGQTLLAGQKYNRDQFNDYQNAIAAYSDKQKIENNRASEATRQNRNVQAGTIGSTAANYFGDLSTASGNYYDNEGRAVLGLLPARLQTIGAGTQAINNIVDAGAYALQRGYGQGQYNQPAPLNLINSTSNHNNTSTWAPAPPNGVPTRLQGQFSTGSFFNGQEWVSRATGIPCPGNRPC